MTSQVETYDRTELENLYRYVNGDQAKFLAKVEEIKQGYINWPPENDQIIDDILNGIYGYDPGTEFYSSSVLFPGMSVSTGNREFVFGVLIVELEALLGKLEEDKIKISQERVQACQEQKLVALEKAERKQERARKQNKGFGFWNRFKLGMSYATATGTLILGAVMFGTPAGSAMIQSGSLQLFLAVDQTVALATGGYGIAGSLALLCNASKAEARKADEVVRYTVMAIIVLSAISSIATGIFKLFTAAPTIAGSAATTATAMQTGAAVAKASLTLTSAAGTLVVCTGDVYYAVQNLEAAMLRKDSKFLQGEQVKLDAMIQQLMTLMDAAQKFLENSGNADASNKDSILERAQDKARAFQQMRFSA